MIHLVWSMGHADAKPARWQFGPRQLAAGESSATELQGAYRDKSRGYRTPCVGRRRAGCWLLFVVDYVMRILYKCPQCKIASDRRWGPRPGRVCRGRFGTTFTSC